VALLTEGRLVAVAPPTELRRHALGGDVIEVTTESAFDVRALPAVPTVRAVRQGGPRTFLVVADDAGTATPRVVEAAERQGASVTSTREYRPSFDEVFASLVEADRARRGAARHGQSG
jgi:ABC-type multidrug transport system ATPase subunit